MPRYNGGFIGHDGLDAPDAPTIGTPSAGSSQADIAFTAGAAGTTATTEFVATTNDGIGATGTSSPITITGLTNGTSYTARVYAKNSHGTSAASAASASFTPLAEVISSLFSTHLYTGNSSTRTITNDINLSGKGGLVWIKDRDSSSNSNILYDTERGAYKGLFSNLTNAEDTRSTGLTGFTSSGFTLGSLGAENGSSNDKVSWTWRKQAKYFDIVTYTGNGTAGRTISHNLGSIPGMIMIKQYQAGEARSWSVYHRGMDSSAPEDYYMRLETTGARSDDVGQWNDTAPTSSVFTVGDSTYVNSNGESYVAYLFAHNNNDGGFGPDGEDIIKCGSFTGVGTGAVNVNLGFEPQWIMVKNATRSEGWFIQDSMRGMAHGDWEYLLANEISAAAGSATNRVVPTATGFTINNNGSSAFGQSGDTCIYVAIRRPDQSTPTAGTSVFQAHTYTGDGSTRKYSLNITPDMVINLSRNISGDSPSINDRVRGSGKEMYTSGTGGQASYPSQGLQLDHTNAIEVQDYRDTNTKNYLNLCWKRAKGYFDIVAYSGTGSNRTVTHNLGAAPEMMWIKRYDTTGSWMVYHKGLNGGTNPEQYVFYLHDPQGPDQSSGPWNNTAPTSSVFSVGTNNAVNNSSGEYVAYLFATVAGVSKVGSYTSTIDATGNGTNQTIDCGFTNGARFVFIKRSDGAGDWVIFDSTRGITTNSDPHYRLNQTYTEDSDAYVDIEPHSSGFIVNPGSVHVGGDTQGQTYVFYAIA